MQYTYDPNYFLYAHMFAQYLNSNPPLQFQINIYNQKQKSLQDKNTVVSPSLNQSLASIQDFLPDNNQKVKKPSKNLKKYQQKKQKGFTKAAKSNENRNILPNSMHQILSYVQKGHKSQAQALRIFEKICPNEEWNVKRYYNYQKSLRQKIHYYLKQDSLKLLTSIYNPKSQVYSIQEQHFYMKVSRILAMKYINQESIPLFLTSRRMQSSKKIQHFKNRRQLIKKASFIFQQI